jgi:hypothetical protein
MFKHVNAVGETNFFRYTYNWRNGSSICNDLQNNSSNNCTMLDEVIVAIM